MYEAEKDKILVAERGVLHALEFCFNVEHAYKTVLLTVKREARNDKEIAQVAWNFCNDRCVDWMPMGSPTQTTRASAPSAPALC